MYNPEDRGYITLELSDQPHRSALKGRPVVGSQGKLRLPGSGLRDAGIAGLENELLTAGSFELSIERRDGGV